MDKANSKERAERQKEKKDVKEKLKNQKYRKYYLKLDKEQSAFVRYCEWRRDNDGGSILKALKEGLENGNYA